MNEHWGLGGCRGRIFYHWGAFGGSYGCLGSIWMDLGVILGSILRVISVRKCVIVQALCWLVVGCGFCQFFVNLEIYFGVFRSKNVVYHETCEIVKNLCFTHGIQWFPGLGSIFWATICRKTDSKSELGSEAVFCWFVYNFRSFWAPFWDQNSIKKRYEIWIDFWRVLGGAPGIPSRIRWLMFAGPGVPGEGRVRVEPSPKVMWDISMDLRI